MDFGCRSLGLILMPLYRENLACGVSFDKRFGTLICTHFRSSENEQESALNLLMSFPDYECRLAKISVPSLFRFFVPGCCAFGTARTFDFIEIVFSIVFEEIFEALIFLKITKSPKPWKTGN